MIELYHFGNAICAQKVRIALSENNLAWTSHELAPNDLRSAEYLSVNPKGVVPTLVHNGEIFVESRLISEYLVSLDEEARLLPQSPAARYRSKLWSKQVDDSLHLNAFILSFVCSMRKKFLEMPKHLLDQALPGLTDPIKRSISVDLLEKGYSSRYIGLAVARFKTLLEDMDAELGKNKWLAGDEYSLADADLTPYAKRLEDIGLRPLIQRYQNVLEWIDRCRARPSYQKGILDWQNTELEKRIEMQREAAETELLRYIDS